MRPNRDRSELYWIGRKLKLSVAMPKLLGGVEKTRPFFANGRILVCITGVLVDLRKLFKTPLQFRLARAFNCHTEQTAVPLLVKGYFWRAFLRRFLEPAVFCHDCNVASYCIGKCYGIKRSATRIPSKPFVSPKQSATAVSKASFAFKCARWGWPTAYAQTQRRKASRLFTLV